MSSSLSGKGGGGKSGARPAAAKTKAKAKPASKAKAASRTKPARKVKKAPKATARKMITMMMAINKGNFDGKQAVTCYTCHRGATEPAMAPAEAAK